MTMAILRTALCALAIGVCRAFLSKPLFSLQKTRLFGLSEWRELELSPEDADAAMPLYSKGTKIPNIPSHPKPLCLLPFPFREVLLQGQTKQLRLYEDRFIKLFDDCMENHHGVLGMALMTADGLVQTVSLCEVEDYNRMGGDFGIFLTIRVVGRARLTTFTQQVPYLRAIASEHADTVPRSNLTEMNMLADEIDVLILKLSNMESRKERALVKKDKHALTRQRKALQQWEETFSSRVSHSRNYDDEEDRKREEADHILLDRRGRFTEAYRMALDTDTLSDTTTLTTTNQNEARSFRELNAISWAVFSTDMLPDNDLIYRIQAMDGTDVSARLRLGRKMLLEKFNKLMKDMESIDEDSPDQTDEEEEEHEEYKYEQKQTGSTEPSFWIGGGEEYLDDEDVFQ